MWLGKEGAKEGEKEGEERLKEGEVSVADVSHGSESWQRVGVRVVND